ncbi:hypothetical protein LFM09_02660 [Lentzea alba]|uniref:hypothetical protein n=1 Tax=Lentzea alba TaxID=2714351 RepID=UPI0039BEEEA3
MSRSSTSTGALLLSVVLSLGMSAGPAHADEAPPAETPAVTAPATPEPEPERPLPEPEPVETPTPVDTPAPAPEEPVDTPAPAPEEPVAEPSAQPVPAAPVEEKADLRLRVTFEKSSYTADEQIVARAEVINAGTATAFNVRVSSTGNLDSQYWHWEASTLPPGETASGYAAGYVTDTGGKVALAVEVASDTPEANPADNAVTITADVKVLRGNFAGIVYGDANGSKAMDPGEAIAGLRVRTSGGHPYADFETVTDSAGRFAFRGLPIGRYSTQVYNETDWYFPYTSVVVDEVDDPDVLIRGSFDVNRVLTATAEFTESAYAKGDIAHLKVTVTNSAAGPVVDLVGDCSAHGGKLISAGELGQPGGTTMPARTTRTFDVTYEINDEGVRLGTMRASCMIGVRGSGSVYVNVLTRVPGAKASRVVCQLRRITAMPPLLGPPQSVPQPGVKVYLRSQVTGKVVVTAVSDEEGFFEFRDVLADLYDFGVVGPFKGPETFQVYADDNGSQSRIVYVTEGPEQPDVEVPEEPREPEPSAPGPAPAPPHTGTPDPVLAVTGADVGWLALGGLLSLVSGVALLTITRRARSAG